MNKIFEAETIIKIPFFDVDPMGVVWHGNYAKYFEIARCTLMEKLNYNYNQMKESGYAFPIVKMNTKYIRPCFFDQEIKITAKLIEYENYIGIKYIIMDWKTKDILTKGYTSQMAIDMKTLKTCFVLPDIFLDKIKS